MEQNQLNHFWGFPFSNFLPLLLPSFLSLCSITHWVIMGGGWVKTKKVDIFCNKISLTRVCYITSYVSKPTHPVGTFPSLHGLRLGRASQDGGVPRSELRERRPGQQSQRSEESVEQQVGSFIQIKISAESIPKKRESCIMIKELIPYRKESTRWCKFMSKNLNLAREIPRGGRGRTRVSGATKKREISRTS